MDTGEETHGAAYDAVAHEYAATNETAPFNALYERPAVIDLLGDVRAKRVLDVGCGSGVLSHGLSRTAPTSLALM